MLILTRPVNQARLNACVFDLIGMNIDGEVCIPGAWDCYDALGYLEKRLKLSVIATLLDNGSIFIVCGKRVCFAPELVVVSRC
jgi:hypothetical protein